MVNFESYLCKARRKDNNEWVEGFYFFMSHGDGSHFIMPVVVSFLGILTKNQVEVNPDTLCRYTGMTDKKGNKIWEYDVVKTKYGRLYVVKWFSSDSYCGWDLDSIKTNENLSLKPPQEAFVFCSKDNEVVVNLFDKPALIKEKVEKVNEQIRFD